MENYNISDLMKAENVTRWHTVPTVRSQSLAEHQWNVCMIATSLALSMDLDDSQVALIQAKALIHDMEEVWTGDMPSPYKEGLERTGASPRNTRMGVGTPIAGISGEAEGRPPGVPEIYHNGMVTDVLRGADLIDAWRWAVKYVLDPDVVTDCYYRMDKFMCNSHSHLYSAMDKLIKEL